MKKSDRLREIIKETISEQRGAQQGLSPQQQEEIEAILTRELMNSGFNRDDVVKAIPIFWFVFAKVFFISAMAYE